MSFLNVAKSKLLFRGVIENLSHVLYVFPEFGLQKKKWFDFQITLPPLFNVICEIITIIREANDK